MGERRDGIYWSKTESSEAHSPFANSKQDIGASDRNLVRFGTTASNRRDSSSSVGEVKTNFGWYNSWFGSLRWTVIAAKAFVTEGVR